MADKPINWSKLFWSILTIGTLIGLLLFRSFYPPVDHSRWW